MLACPFHSLCVCVWRSLIRCPVALYCKVRESYFPLFHYLLLSLFSLLYFILTHKQQLLGSVRLWLFLFTVSPTKYYSKRSSTTCFPNAIPFVLRQLPIRSLSPPPITPLLQQQTCLTWQCMRLERHLRHLAQHRHPMTRQGLMRAMHPRWGLTMGVGRPMVKHRATYNLLHSNSMTIPLVQPLYLITRVSKHGMPSLVLWIVSRTLFFLAIDHLIPISFFPIR